MYGKGHHWALCIAGLWAFEHWNLILLDEHV